jgi:hypothetical protein
MAKRGGDEQNVEAFGMNKALNHTAFGIQREILSIFFSNYVKLIFCVQ